MEGRRVLGNRLFLAVLMGLVVLNCFFFVYQQSGGQEDFRGYGDAYHDQLEDLSDRSWEEGLAWCDETLRQYQNAMNEGSLKYTPELGKQLEILEQLQSQYEYLLGYEEYLAKIEKDAKKLQAVSLFADPHSFGYKNTVKTAGDFAAMGNVQVSAGHDLAVTAFFEDKWPDYSILILMCVVCGLFAAERKEGLWPMIHAAPGGRWRLAVKRIGILFAAAWIGAAALVGSKLLLCGWMYHGLGEWDRILQSIPMFQNVPTPMTVGQFWLLYLAVKAVGAFWIGLALWAVLSSISNLGLALSAAGLLMGVEYACTAIPSSSMFNLLRYVNVFSYVDFATVFTRYLNLDLFGILISGSDLVLAILPLLCIVFIVLNAVIAERKHPVSPANRLLRWFDGIQKKLDPMLAGGGEARKLLIKRRGILLLILLAVLASQSDAPPREYIPWDPYIQFYQQEYAGPITEEKLEAMEAKLAASLDSGNAVGLRVVLEDAQNAPAGAWIVPTAPYDAIWGDNVGNYHRTTALTALLFLVLILAPIASQERQNDMTILLRSTSGGRKKLMRRKQLLLLLVTAAVWAMVYGTELVSTVLDYGAFHCLGAPAYSLDLFQTVTLPLGWMLALYYAAKLLVMVAVGEVCFFLSSRCGKNRDAILLCSAVILIPAALAAIGSAVGEHLSFLLPLGGTELFGALFQ